MAIHAWKARRKSDYRLLVNSGTAINLIKLKLTDVKRRVLNRIKRHLRELLIYLFFNLKKSAAEAHRLHVETYGEAAALSERSCREWFQKFKNGGFDIEDKERTLEVQTQHQQAISQSFKIIGND